MNCCANYINIGCYDTCEDCVSLLDFGIFNVTDRFTISYSFANSIFRQNVGTDAMGYIIIDISLLPHNIDILMTIHNDTTDLDVTIVGEKDGYSYDYTCFKFSIKQIGRTLTTECDVIETDCDAAPCGSLSHILQLTSPAINIQRVYNSEEQIGYVVSYLNVTVGTCVESINLKRYYLEDVSFISYPVPIVFLSPTVISNPADNIDINFQLGPFLYSQFNSTMPVSLTLTIVLSAFDEKCGYVEYIQSIPLTLL